MDDKWSALEKYNLWNGNSYKLGLLRTSYINKIHAFVGNKLVKVLVGQRRSGKSYILRQIASGLISDLVFILIIFCISIRNIWNLIS